MAGWICASDAVGGAVNVTTEDALRLLRCELLAALMQNITTMNCKRKNISGHIYAGILSKML